MAGGTEVKRRVAQALGAKKNLGAAHAGFACAGLESTSCTT